MRYPVLLFSDPHFTANPRDEYRWGLWAWMRAKCKELGVRSVVCLGDLSDAKDFHPSALVNRIAREIKELSEVVARIYMIPGNHEWLKQNEEFWRFLALMSDNIHYFTHTADDPIPARDGPNALFLPFTKTPIKDWAGMHTFEDYDLVFMHQTVKGSRSSNGEEMAGEDLPLELLRTARKVWSGDIHVPQKIDCVEYVGSPYHVHFGDSFRPRCVLLTGPKDREDLRFPTISRVTLDVGDLQELAEDAGNILRPRDQVKVRIRLLASEKHEWKAIRRKAYDMMTAAAVEVHGLEMIVVGANGQPVTRELVVGRSQSLDPAQDVTRYVRAEELGADALDAALEVIEQ